MAQCKGHFLYKPFVELPNLSEFVGSFIEMRIEACYLTHFNPAIIKRNLWGNDVYTSNSDIVCILVHSGAYFVGALPPDCGAVSAFFKVSKNKSTYNNIFKNGIKSRKITNQTYEGHTIKLEFLHERSGLINENDNLVDISQFVYKMPTLIREIRRKQKVARKAFKSFRTLYGIQAENFGLSKGTNERDSEFMFVFSLSGQPVKRYTLGEFADKKSLDPEEPDYFVSDALKTQVLYVESLNSRYEVSRTLDNMFEINKVKDPIFKGPEYMREVKTIPLPKKDLDP